jgi:uncharacterized protein YdhG (YjbR/CyaY superfamily)
MEGKDSRSKTIDEYIANCPPEVQPVLNEIRAVIHETAPQAKEKISYQMPAFDQNGILVYFAAFKNHIGFFPTGEGIEAFKDELAGYKFSKGGVQFPLDQPMPFDLIRRIVRHRVEENQKKKNKTSPE